MESFSAMQVDRAIARLTEQSNASIKQVLVNARQRNSEVLVKACQDELRTRGSWNFSTADAQEMTRISNQMIGKNLLEIIEVAFKEVPAKPEEIQILRWISQHPGTSHAETKAFHGKDDLSLVIGHLIHYRLGYFRSLIKTTIQSDILLERDNSSGGVCYTLRSEAIKAFENVGVLQSRGHSAQLCGH